VLHIRQLNSFIVHLYVYAMQCKHVKLLYYWHHTGHEV